MSGMRKRHSREVKLRVVCEALAGIKSISQIASDHGVHPTQIKEWKSQALEAMGERFSLRRGKKTEAAEERLYEEIGRLKVENDFLSGKLKR
jgi:transposase-like protein